MDIMNTMLYLMVNAFHIYIFALAYQVSLGQSPRPRYVEVGCYVLFYAANSIAFLLIRNPYLNLATSVLPLLVLTFLYKGKIRTKLLFGVLICLSSMLLESVSFYGMQFLELDVMIENPVIGNLASNMLLFTAILVYGKARQNKTHGNVGILHWLAIATLPAGSMTIVVLSYAAGYATPTNLVIVALLILMNVFVFQLYGILDNYYFLRYEHTLLQRQNKAYAHEFELIRGNDENMRIVRHDLKNHIVIMKQLLEQGELSRLGQYLANMSEHSISKKEYVSSGNSEIDSIMNYKLATAETLGAKMEIEVRVPNQLTLPAYDLSAILGNLLDNAVDALADCPDKYLKVLIYFDRGVLYIHISNSYAGELKKVAAGGRTAYISRKHRSDMHGVGLASVARTIERYDGVMEIEDGEHCFVVSIMLYLPN